MRRIFVLLLGVILAWFGFAGSAAAGADIPSPAVASHRYDPPADTATASIVTTERGPSSAYDPSTSYSAVAPRSLGASACPAGTISGATTTYDNIARPVRVRGDHHRADKQVGRAGADPVVVDRSDVAANSGDDLTRVGRWMSRDEHSAMVRTQEVQVGGGGTTYVSHPPSIDVWRRQASPGSVYVEFDVPRSVLRPGGQPGHAQIPSPSHPLYGRLAEKTGVPLQYPVPACNIVLVGSC